MNRMNLRQYTLELERRMESAFRLAATNLRATQDLYMTPHQMGETILRLEIRWSYFILLLAKMKWLTRKVLLFFFRNLRNANDLLNLYVSRLKKKH